MDVGPAAVAAAATTPETTMTYRSRPEAFPSRGEHQWWPAQVCTPHCTYERGKRSAWRGSVGIGSNCPVTWPPRTSPRFRSSHLLRGYVYACRIILCKCNRTDLGRLVLYNQICAQHIFSMTHLCPKYFEWKWVKIVFNVAKLYSVIQCNLISYNTIVHIIIYQFLIFFIFTLHCYRYYWI